MILQNTGTSAAYRTYGDFPVNTGNWTIIVRFKYGATPAVFVSVWNLFDGLVNFTDPYLYLGSGASFGTVVLEYFDGTTTTTTTEQAIVNNAQNWAAVTYNATTHILTLIVNGSTVDTLSANLSAKIWDSLYVAGSTTASTDPVSVAYFRAWSSILSGAEITVEVASISAVVTTGLIWDCPLQASIDLTSHNNTFNQLVATGTITTDTDDPLLSITVGPPTNITPATAIVASTSSAIFVDVVSGGAAVTTWWKVTPTSNIKEMGVGVDSNQVLNPAISIYNGLANANANITLLSIAGTAYVPIQFPVVFGNTYYIRVTGSAITPATLILSVLNALDLPVSVGSIAISDDIVGFPLALLNSSTGCPINFMAFVPTGEGGMILPNGKLLITDESVSTNLFLYDAQLNFLLSPVITGTYSRVSSNGSSRFYIGSDNAGVASVARIATVDEFGVVGTTTWDLTVPGIWALGVNPLETIAYYVVSNTNGLAVKRWDLVNDIALTDLVAGIANYLSFRDILVLSDETILVGYFKSSATKNIKVLHYSTTGTILNIYDFGSNVANQDCRICHAIDSPNSFWIWIKLTTTNGYSVFKNVKISNGSILSTTLDVLQYEGGEGQSVSVFPPQFRFGHSESCPFWITRAVLAPVVASRSGIYYLTGTGSGNPTQRYDTLWIDTTLGTTENVKIP